MDLRPRSAEIDQVAFPAGADASDRARLLALARGYQRSIEVTDNIAATEALVAAGLASATAVARITPEKAAAITGLPLARAMQIHSRGVDIAINASVDVANITDITRGGFIHTAVSNVSGKVADSLKEIPGCTDFFGNQYFCDCKHCKSVFGPAAYFVDLMRIRGCARHQCVFRCAASASPRPEDETGPTCEIDSSSPARTRILKFRISR
jgi:hypothetical protein